MNNFVKERDEAIKKAVLDDDWEPVKKYSIKYGVPLPKSERVMKAGIYKACQECLNIPQEVKEVAYIKCINLGFEPYM